VREEAMGRTPVRPDRSGARSEAACASGGNQREVIRKEENPRRDAHPVSDLKMLPAADDPAARD
jgi:hypothetical protein